MRHRIQQVGRDIIVIVIDIKHTIQLYNLTNTLVERQKNIP